MSSPASSFSRPLWGHLGGNTTFPSQGSQVPTHSTSLLFQGLFLVDVNRVSVKEGAFMSTSHSPSISPAPPQPPVSRQGTGVLRMGPGGCRNGSQRDGPGAKCRSDSILVLTQGTSQQPIEQYKDRLRYVTRVCVHMRVRVCMCMCLSLCMTFCDVSLIVCDLPPRSLTQTGVPRGGKLEPHMASRHANMGGSGRNSQVHLERGRYPASSKVRGGADLREAYRSGWVGQMDRWLENGD